jgi:16S rRNA (cytosine1402-N4)-methyltransferase
MNNYHTSVLLQETIETLQVKPGKRYIDGTLGGGGHTTKILELGGKVLGIDFDQDALDFNEEKFKVQNSKFKIGEDVLIARGNFKDIDNLAKENGFLSVDGVLFDLGVSSHHFDTAERGFSVQKTGPLDMRMDQELGVKAGDLLNVLTKGELYELFTKFGEERFAYAISNSIVRARQIKRIETTTDLVGIINRVVPKGKESINPATRVFQALRIAVNDELNNITEALPKALELLKSKGRIVVISFHSLEDRIIKNTFKEWEEKGFGTIITKKPIVPSESEIEVNNRSRSSKLRVFEKI